MISVQNISFTQGDKKIFDQTGFTIGEQIRVGLVGPNGAGKSTLFRLLLGEEVPPEGSIATTGKITLVPQEVTYDPHLEASDSVRAYVDPEHKKEDFELKTIFAGLELENLSLDALPKNLSGGQKTKLALARALIEEPEILLLDEPTNFMDVAGKKWVMRFLSTYPHALIVVSHDLELMDNYIDKVLAINTQTKKIEEYTGTYSTYIKLKAEYDALMKRQLLEKQKQIRKLEEGLKVVDRFSRKRSVMHKRIERLKENLPEMPQELRKFKLNLPEPTRVGELPLKAIDIAKSYGERQVLSGVTFPLYRGQRIALIGYNGAGKSTLIKILVGKLDADSGEVYRDKSLKIGYYSQEFETLDLRKTLLETMEERYSMREETARGFLARFLFAGNKIYQKIETLSGGEKTRFSIALLMLEDYNLLVLDEPTTYLDVLSQRIILEALKNYKGSMIVVSHTEEFIKELHPDKALLLPENRFVEFTPELLDRVSEV